MALKVVLQPSADQLEGLLLAILALVVHDEALHGQRLTMFGVLLQNLSARMRVSCIILGGSQSWMHVISSAPERANEGFEDRRSVLISNCMHD